MAYTYTPTEDLIIETLTARYRLGEYLWTFDKRQKKALESLASKGIVNVMNGIVEDTVRASFTDLGEATFLSYEYEPPIARDSKKMRAAFALISDRAKKKRRRFNLG